jgi:cytochrome c peroxidase
MKKKLFIGTLMLGLIVLHACQKLEDTQAPGMKLELPEQPYDYATPVNQSFFNPYGDSTINNHVATLGRVLFYDTRLSYNYRTSCGSCHIQNYGFADNRKGSVGFKNEVTSRNTQTIVNTGTQTGFFWDLRELTLDHMVLQPIANLVEMGMHDYSLLEERIRETEYYKPLFVNAFGSDVVTTHKIGLALAQFVKSIVSVSSKYDKGRKMVDPNSTLNNAANFIPFPNFTDLENEGKRLFFRKFPCSQCHGGVNLDGSLSAPMNVGLDEHYSDGGMAGIDPSTGQPRNGFFKTPSLRNIALTGPYMHDGRFKTLEEVIEFYSSGVKAHPQLSDQLRIHEQGGLFPVHVGPFIHPDYIPHEGPTIPQRMYMSESEKEALVAFLNTLTDWELISDPRFASPFK